MASTTPAPAEVQNTACQFKCSKMNPDNGSPIALPIPSVALISATAAGTRLAR